MTKRLFVRLDQSSWRHVGTYKFIPSRPLSVTEFRTLSSAVCIISDDKLDNWRSGILQARATWARNTRSKGWGRSYVARIFLRARDGGTEPQAADVTAICKDKARFDACKLQVSEAQILQAFLSGREVCSHPFTVAA